MSDESSQFKELKYQISELLDELKSKDQIIESYREELVSANARLEGLIGQISQELKVASAIHKTLVPTEFPNIQGFEFSTKFLPSMIAGGDYFDVFSHQDRMKFSLLLSCSSGHAMSALFLSVLLKFTSQMAARRSSEIGNLVKDILSTLQSEMGEMTSADLFYAVVDRRRYEMDYVRLGNIVGLHITGEGEMSLLAASGPLILRDSSTDVASHKLSLNPRDRLVVCSRGVIEAKNLKGEAFGLERLSRVLADAHRRTVHEIRNEVLIQLKSFTKGADLQRDLTILAVEVRDRVIKLAKTTG